MKQMKSKNWDRNSISLRTPKSSIGNAFELIALMSSRLSDRIQTLEDLCCCTVVKASLRAKASAIRGEATYSARAWNSVVTPLCFSSINQPKPAEKDSLNHDASQLTIEQSDGIGSWSSALVVDATVPLKSPWASSHSRAPNTAFDTTEKLISIQIIIGFSHTIGSIRSMGAMEQWFPSEEGKPGSKKWWFPGGATLDSQFWSDWGGACSHAFFA